MPGILTDPIHPIHPIHQVHPIANGAVLVDAGPSSDHNGKGQPTPFSIVSSTRLTQAAQVIPSNINALVIISLGRLMPYPFFNEPNQILGYPLKAG